MCASCAPRWCGNRILKNREGLKRSVKEKVTVLSVSFVLFIVGMLALSMERGGGRTIVLALVILALAAVAARQTIQKLKKKE